MNAPNPSAAAVDAEKAVSGFAKWPIRAKIAALVSIGLVIMAIAVGAPIFFTADTLFAREAETQLDRQNETIASEIDLLSAKAASDLLLARQNEAFNRLYLTGDQSALEAVQKQMLYLQDRFSIDEICLISANGAEKARCVQGRLAGLDDLSPDESGNPFFLPTLALADGEVYRSPAPYVSPDTHRWVVAHATPIVLPDGTKAGIFHFEIPLAWFAAKVETGGLAGGYSFLMTRDGQMLVHPNLEEMRRSAGIDPSDPDQAAFPPATALASDDFQRLAEHMKSEQSGSGTYRVGSETYKVIFRPAFNNAWIVATVLSQSAINRPASTLFGRTLVIIIPLLLLVVGAMLWYTARLVLPIARLTNVVQRAIAGDLSGHVPVESADEVGTLAAAFNTMTTKLQESFASLQHRTDDLNTARIQSENRANHLETISEVSRIVSGEHRLDILLPLITRLVSEKFSYYHAGIFLMDDGGRFAVLHASNSEGGQRMLNRGHKLESGRGIVGTAALTGSPRIALDVGTDAVFFDNPDLPNTRSEVALPLRVRNQVIGVLDVQSTRSGEFTNENISVLGVLADQVAIAIENARLIARNTQALNEVQLLYNQFLQKEWKSLQAKATNIGYLHTLRGGTPLEKPVESMGIRDVLESGSTLVAQ